MSTEIKNIPGGKSVAGVDLHNQTAGNEAATIQSTDSGVRIGDTFDLSTLEGQKAYLARLQSLGIRASDLPSFVTNMDTNGFISGMTQKERNSLKLIASSISSLASSGSGTSAQVQGQWADFVAQKKISSNLDVNALVEFVLRESYLESNKDLQFYAQKVRFYNDLKRAIRDELVKARELLATKAGNKETDPVNWSAYTNSAGSKGAIDFPTTPVMDPNGNPVPAPPVAASGAAATKEGLESYIKNLEEKLNSVGDDAQLANVDLQNMLQKQQQTLQMMSNISKMLHDTALAIIRKIGG